MKKTMNILCASDRNFLYPTYVFMASVMENHKELDLRFYLLSGEDVIVNPSALPSHILSILSSCPIPWERL